jgi:type IV secretion system protein VirB8
MVAQAEQAYLNESNAWEADVYQRALSRSKIWGVVAAVAITFAGLCVLAVMLLIPLKTVEPFVFVVDKASGLVDVVQPLNEGGISQNEAVIK